jgi:trehalose 6-phosphate synthase/phosphatase
MEKLLIVSNRLPVTINKKNKKIFFKKSLGGLATGLSSFYEVYNGKWIGWIGTPTENLALDEKKYIKKKLLEEFSSYPVFLSKNNVKLYYNEFCNKTLWPILHGFTQYAAYNRKSWMAYKEVNKIFTKSILEVINPNDTIWIHDYHLMLLPAFLREKYPDLTIGFFLHTPFPHTDIFRLIPWREKILSCLLQADLLGFHTYSYMQNFLLTVQNLVGLTHNLGKMIIGDRLIKADSFPIGINYEVFANAQKSAEVQKKIKKLNKKLGETKKILSIDRLDYTKGVIQRLKGYNRFLNKYPEYKKNITLVLVAVPSRTKVADYQSLKKTVDEIIGRINGEHGLIGWTPIQYIYRSLPFNYLKALYSLSDIALITPLKDGMNLIAKEFIASKTDGLGVLILSEMAGASEELNEALIINPNNIEEIADSLKTALSMPEKEQINKNRIMQERIQSYNINTWADDFMNNLKQIKTEQQEFSSKKANNEIKTKIINNFQNSEKRLIFLDYDGTLVPFESTPEKAKPNNQLKSFLSSLANNPKTQVVIISGRNKENLEDFFTDRNIGIVAEHGAWIREKNGNWKITGDYKRDWKEKIKPVLERYKNKTPGALVEEKNYSLVWHYRRSKPELSAFRVAELKNTIYFLIANLNLEIAEGHKILEIKNIGINKGKAAKFWLTKDDWDFILAIGDDATDEDLFQELPKQAYSIKIGVAPSKAKYHFRSQNEVIPFLKQIK